MIKLKLIPKQNSFPPTIKYRNQAAAFAFFAIWPTVWDDISSMSGNSFAFSLKKKKIGKEKIYNPNL